MAITDYQNFSYSDADGALKERFQPRAGVYRSRQNTFAPLEEIKARRSFDEDDAWQEGRGYIGQLPTGDGASERTELLKKAFSPEPVISEILDTHVENVLGDEPQISLEDNSASENERLQTLEIVKDWYAHKDLAGVIEDALRGARRDGARILRVFIPTGNIGASENGEKRVIAKDLREALSKIFIRSENIEEGGVLLDENTATNLGLFRYRMRIDERDVSLCEYTYLDQNNNTVWGTKSAHETNKGEELAEPFRLGGLLPIYQINAKPLITGVLCQAQKNINLSGTMLTRNNNLAGSRERLALGVQPPGNWIEQTNASGRVKVFQPAEMPTGPGTFNFLNGQPIFDKDGNVTAFSNPNVIFTDPVPIDTFTGTSEHWRRVIYSKAKMRHLFMADDATASGRSRIEARKEFQASLNYSKSIVDSAGAWAILIALRIAAEFMEQPEMFAAAKVNFDAQVSTAELTPEEKAEIRADYEAGLIDLQTALEMMQYKNVAEIMERIERFNRTIDDEELNNLNRNNSSQG